MLDRKMVETLQDRLRTSAGGRRLREAWED